MFHERTGFLRGALSLVATAWALPAATVALPPLSFQASDSSSFCSSPSRYHHSAPAAAPSRAATWKGSVSAGSSSIVVMTPTWSSQPEVAMSTQTSRPTIIGKTETNERTLATSAAMDTLARSGGTIVLYMAG